VDPSTCHLAHAEDDDEESKPAKKKKKASKKKKISAAAPAKEKDVDLSTAILGGSSSRNSMEVSLFSRFFPTKMLLTSVSQFIIPLATKFHFT
jgi:hypothetical protein